jgi:alanyl-tRNA synthetase
LRFDFTHPEGLSRDQIRKVEELVNKQIADSLNVGASIMNKDQAQDKGAMALFGEKYGDEVRVVEMGNFSVELCGGTHVTNTSEIGLFKILTEQSLSSGIRRIEAITSETANKYLADRDETLSTIERLLSAKGDLLDQKVNNLLKEVKDKSKEIKALKQQLQENSMGDIFDRGLDLGNGHTLTIAPVETSNIGELRGLSDKFIDQKPEGILLLYNTESEKLTYLLRTNKKNKEIKLNNILKEALPLINGRGGGRPDMVQGSGESANVDKFISTIQAGLQA